MTDPVYLGPPDTGRGGWYSDHKGKYVWEDPDDKRDSNRLGVPDECQGIALQSYHTLGHWYEVTAPNGVRVICQQTDIGPGRRTKRRIDIAAPIAELLGYSPNGFPTNGVFHWRPIQAPASVFGLSQKQQAIEYHKQRSQPV